MRNKMVLNALAALVLIACVMIGATLAYLTDTAEANINYAYGTVKVTAAEPMWKTQTNYFENEKAVLVPGRTFQKDLVVTAAANSEPCYVRLKVEIGVDLAKVVQVDPNINQNWRLDPTSGKQVGDKITSYYIYQPQLQPGATTPPPWTKVKVLSTLPFEPDSTKHAEYLARANDQSIDITAEAIQAATFKDAWEAFGAYDKGEGI